MNEQTQRELVILGTGYTGRAVYKKAISRRWLTWATSRAPTTHLNFVPPERRIHFDLSDRTTWSNLPHDCDLLWCFPAEPFELVREFARAINVVAGRLVVLGSTSAYHTGPSGEDPPPWIDETAPLDQTKARVQGEEFLRTTCGAIILRVAGIYGPGRNPLTWIKRGRVGPSRKYVNLIHVDDLAEVCLATLTSGGRGEIYNVSDGVPRTWQDICHLARERFGIHPVGDVDTDSAGKRIDNSKLLALLARAGTPLLYTDLRQSLDHIVAVEASTEVTP
ncbi:MAG: hypothetical protein NNA20_08210 [Nitrospira sp.]|nr:hypothetical protein [Nitrospira sp.]